MIRDVSQSKPDATAAPIHLMTGDEAIGEFMERETFLEHYRICRNDAGAAEEIARSGDIITYKAEGISTGERFALQLIPTAKIDQSAREQFEEQARAIQALSLAHVAKLIAFGVEKDYFVFISEYLPGETVESWIAAHGPIPPDAALRIALQVMSALIAASNHGLMYRAIQPSNLTIVPNEIAEGGWPFIKITNFRPAELRLESEQFASPEQMQDSVVDFRSEIYSLGATICFLLSGMVVSTEARLRQIGQFPKPLRNVLTQTLQTNPDDRPQDSLLFVESLRTALQQVERRQAFGRRLGVPFVTAASPLQPRRRASGLRRGLAVAALLVAAGAVAAVLLPEDVVRKVWHRGGDAKTIGVPIGLPEASATSAPEVAANPTFAPTPEVSSTSTPMVIAQENKAEPSPPAKGPETSPSVEEEDVASADTNDDAQPGATPDIPAKTQPPVTTNEQKSSTSSHRTRVPRVPPNEFSPGSTIRSGSFPALYVGTTRDGRLIFRLPNGELKYVRPRYHRLRSYPLQRRAPTFEPPYQPFD